MITSPNRSYSEVFLRISENSDGFRIQTGKINSPENFTADQAILISAKNPNILWDLLHVLMGIPYPVLQPLVETPKNEDKPISNPNFDERDPMEEELKKLSAKQIVEKVLKEKGITIGVNLKSKALIIKKALTILSANNPA